MDSFNFHFERMSNIDLHPLSLPMSRLSPAKSSSSIVEQFAQHHHQHGKGDSAYSSFSGGSTAPDYPSPFLADDLQSSSFSHYSDLKYVRSLYNPSQVLQSDPKTMDQLYQSVEAISQQCCHSNNNLNHYNGGESGYGKVKQEMASQSGYVSHYPPPIPARLDSFITTKNLENMFGHQQEPQQPQPQMPRLKTEEYNSRRGPPTYHPHHLPKDQPITQTNQEYFFVNSNNQTELQKIGKILSQSPPKSEHLKPLSSHVDPQVKHVRNSLENHRRQAQSMNDWVGSDSHREYKSWCVGQNVLNSSIQHKGQFYFVTGVCKTKPDQEVRQHSSSVCGLESGSELETYKLRERCHSTMENLFRPVQHRPGASNRDERGFISVTKCNNVVNMCHNEETQRQSLSKSSRSLESLEEIRDIGRHTPHNPIFYCGPKSPLQMIESTSFSNDQPKHGREELANRVNRQSLGEELANRVNRQSLGEESDNSVNRQSLGEESANSVNRQSLGEELANSVNRQSLGEEPTNSVNRQSLGEEPANRVNRQSLGEAASERINKETTPLLYQLTGANRLKTEVNLSHLNVNNEPHVSSSRSMDPACNTLDMSYKKFYKEQLKDVQSRVLRETSFKRKDLLLSWPTRVRENQNSRPAAVHLFTSSQDSEASTETLTPSVTSEKTEKESIKEEESPRQEREKENDRPANVAQPQVARIGGRKRLTLEQKKMYFSEPEKLNQLGGVPSYTPCRSFGNESESVFNVEQETDENIEQCEPGLVAARRKMFETRGRALSASSASKTSLKHLQHKALVEYMERKTGLKVAEPQQPPTRQRHSLGEKPFDWGPRPQSGLQERNQESKKKKLNRPHSAGRILDSSTSSLRYAQFFSTQWTSGPSGGQPCLPQWRESRGPAQGKSASVEDLLDQSENRSLYRNRSTSTPHPFQAFDEVQDTLRVNNTMETHSSHKERTEDIVVKAEGQQPVGFTQRGKSMEELGATKVTRPKALSKSSEQLDHIWKNLPGPEKNNISPEVLKDPDISQQQQLTQGPPKLTHKESPVKQNSEPILGGKDHAVGPQDSCSTTPGPASSAQARIHSHGAVLSESRPVTRAPTEASSTPASPRGPDPSDREVKSPSTPSPAPSSAPSPARSPTQTKSVSEQRHSPRTSSSSTSEIDESVDEAITDLLPPPPPHLYQEVSLSCGITTDPSLWNSDRDIPQLQQDVQNTAPTGAFNDDPTNSPPAPQTAETFKCPGSSVSDPDVKKQTNDDNTPQNEDETMGQNPDLEDRGAPEGETEQDTPNEKPQWEELVVAVVKADQSLARVLYPLTNRKTALMLMEQLLSEDTLLMEEHYKKKQEQRGGGDSAEAEPEAEPEAEFVEIAETFSCPSSQSQADVKEKKRVLASYIEQRLRSLEETRVSLRADVEENEVRGEALQSLVRLQCSPVELDRYNLFIGDLQRVVSLLLCLSARLARVQNALSTVDQDTDAEEKQSLDTRHRLLCKQRDDAKDLKDNLDRRESQVQAFLSRQLSPEQLQEYRRFVQTAASLLIRHKDLDERQRLGEEQLEALSGGL